MKKAIITIVIVSLCLAAAGLGWFFSWQTKALDRQYRQVIIDQEEDIKTLQARIKDLDETLYPACEYFKLNPNETFNNNVKRFLPGCDKLSKVSDGKDLCPLLPEDIVKDVYCHQVKAQKTNSAIDCEKISDQLQRFVCYADLAVKNKDVSICEKIIDPDFVAAKPGENTPFKEAGCYAKIALELKDGTYCKLIKNRYTEESCYYDIVLAGNDPKQCPGLPNLAYIDSCYQQMAIKNLDVSICKNISDSFADLRDECYSYIAVKTNNSELCSFVRDLEIDSPRKRCFNLDQFKK